MIELGEDVAMANLWYGSDEVREFHPVVEKCLLEALERTGLLNKYVIRHHVTQSTTGIPDFCILDRVTGDFVCVIEVKKTPMDVFSRDSGNQAMGYVKELYPLRWKPKHHPYFCVTNIEMTQFYSLREKSSLIGCLLTGSPYDSGPLVVNQKQCIENFTNLLSEFLKRLDRLTEPDFSKHLEAISESFNETFYEIAQILGVNLVRMDKLVRANQEIKQSILYELLRFAFYYYIKETYEMASSKFASFFKDFDVEKLTDLQMITLIQSNFEKAQKIDFTDILQDYTSTEAIVPDRLTKNKDLCLVFNTFIQILRNNAHQGIKKNHNLDHFVSLLTSEVYDKEEMHMSGKIMSDEVLSDILVNFTITTGNELIIDPCCGDGNLLTASYKRLLALKGNNIRKSLHNEILGQIYGIEIDPNLIQLAAFKLICRNLDGVTTATSTNLRTVDLFTTKDTNGFDSLIMNPPFLRNEDMQQETKQRYLANLEECTGRPSFIRQVRQPNLYFYFVEKAVSMLNKNGKASIILMTKFLNNKDGEFLKRFLLPHLDAIISYPPSFFEGFRVTTCIILLSKKQKSDEKVSFLKVIDTDILSKTEEIKRILTEDTVSSDKRYSLVKIPKNQLKPEDNWRTFLIDPDNKFKRMESISIIKPLETFFGTVKRGGADNVGGSSLIYPFSANNPLLDEASKIEPEFIGYGMQVNKLQKGRRKFILEKRCLEAQKGLMVPAPYNAESGTGLSSDFAENTGLKNYYLKASSAVIKGEQVKWEDIVNSAYRSIVRPKIFLPRADRTKHSIYYNPYRNKDILVSTNFFYLDDFKNYNKSVPVEEQLKFVTAWLLSSFGQIQFEMHGNNQEGMRKIEGGMIQKLEIPDLTQLSPREISNVVEKFDKLNDTNQDVSGLETENNPRFELDLAIAELLHSRNSLDFSSPSDFTEFFESFLTELVMDRVNQ